MAPKIITTSHVDQVDHGHTGKILEEEVIIHTLSSHLSSWDQIMRDNGEVLLAIDTDLEKMGDPSALKLASDGRVSSQPCQRTYEHGSSSRQS